MQHIDFWRSIGTNQYILDVIENGYNVPFYSLPPETFLKKKQKKTGLLQTKFSSFPRQFKNY
jgi:hypothetical protein